MSDPLPHRSPIERWAFPSAIRAGVVFLCIPLSMPAAPRRPMARGRRRREA